MNNTFCSLRILFSGVKFIDDFLIEPGSKLSIQFTLERCSKETFRIKDFVCIVFEMFHVLFGKNSSDDLLLSCTLLLICLSVL